MTVPAPDHQPPADLARIIGDQGELVWRNNLGGYTARSGKDTGWFIKWHPLAAGEYLSQEVERLQWLAGRHPVPEVVDYFFTEEAEVLITQAIPGVSGISKAYLHQPEPAIRAIAVGLRRLHSLPDAECPFEWSVNSRLAHAQAHGVVIPANFPVAPPIDELVVCHGDACAPNTLIDNDGGFLAHVDMGQLGVGDRWADLGVALISLERNYAHYDEQIFWDAYGVAPDQQRITYYQELWDLGSRA